MISKDSDFLSSKLKQLKSSVLQKNNNEQMPQTAMNPPYLQNPLRRSNDPTYNPPTYSQLPNPSSYYQPSPFDGRTGGTTVVNTQITQTTTTASANQPRVLSSHLKPSNISYADYERRLQGESQIGSHTEIRRPVSHKVSELDRRLGESGLGLSAFSRPMPHLRTTQDYHSSNNFNGEDTAKVRTVYAHNSNSVSRNSGLYHTENNFYKTQDKSANNGYINIISNKQSGVFGNGQGTESLAKSTLRFTVGEPQTVGVNSYRSHPTTPARQERSVLLGLNNQANGEYNGDNESDLLKTLNKQSFLDKHEHNLMNDLSSKLNNEIENNNKRNEEISALQRNAEIERKRTIDLDEQLREELHHTQMTQKDTINTFDNLEKNNHELTNKEREEGDRAFQLKNELDSTRRENEMLRGELKRLGEVTSEKILDLENNINSIVRMKEFEKENYDMERDKIQNSADFVIEQMKVHFNERSVKLDEHTRKSVLERDKLAVDLRTLTSELKAFNTNADQKINNTLNIVVQEENERHQKEVREVEAKIRIEEEEIARANRRNQELLTRLQNVEREGKTRIMNKKIENTKLKEDYTALDQAYNKLLLQLNNETKEIERKREAVEVLQDEYEDLREKSGLLERKCVEELEGIQIDHEDKMHDLEDNYNQLLEYEKKLIDEIKEENNKIFELQKRHAELIEQVQNSLNNTLQSQFKVANNSRRGFE